MAGGCGSLISAVCRVTNERNQQKLKGSMKTKQIRIPKGHEVQPLKPGELAMDRATCGVCGLSWDDAIITSMTPAPSGRCPFEEYHPEIEPARKTETKHTPGPWRADKWAPGYTVSAPQSHYSVCHLAGCNNADANAHLIAAAPDLLAACKAALEVMVPTGQDTRTDRAIECVKAAIARAEGQ